MQSKLFTREIFPFFGSLLLLALIALFLDAVLHYSNLAWVGRYLGIVGVLLILGSFKYSLRKRKIIGSGNPTTLLRHHEYLAWAGSLLILVHAGVHFNSILGWLAVWAMLINIASGLTGKFLLGRVRKRLEQTRQIVLQKGMTKEQIEEHIYWDTMTFDVVKQWRAVHFPITLAFAVLGLGHIVAIFLFWGWK
jgi:hypothetical protein